MKFSYLVVVTCPTGKHSKESTLVDQVLQRVVRQLKQSTVSLGHPPRAHASHMEAGSWVT